MNGSTSSIPRICAHRSLRKDRAASRHDKAYKILVDVNVTFRLERSVVGSTDSFTGETWLEQLFSVMEPFSADGDNAYVCEHVGLLPVGFRNRFDHCVVNTSNVAPFLFDIPSKLPSAAVREYPCSVRFFIENSAGNGHHTKDGVWQSKRAYPEKIHHEEAVIPQIDSGRGRKVGLGCRTPYWLAKKESWMCRSVPHVGLSLHRPVVSASDQAVRDMRASRALRPP